MARIRTQEASGGCGCQTISGKRVMENGKMSRWKQSVRRRVAVTAGMFLLAGGLLAGCSGGISTQKTEKGYRAVKKYKDAVDAFNKALAATDEKMPDTVKDLLLYRESAEYRGADYGFPGSVKLQSVPEYIQSLQ